MRLPISNFEARSFESVLAYALEDPRVPKKIRCSEREYDFEITNFRLDGKSV